MNRIKFFLTVLALTGLSLSAFAQFPPVGMKGDGTSSSPWEIATAAHMEALADWVNAGNGNATNGVYYKLMNDIDLSEYANGYGWNPIGNDSISVNYSSKSRFEGNFDGNSKVVKNLTINRPTKNKIGLFGYTYQATIENLGVEDCNINGKEYVGGLVGYTFYNTNITNCYTTGKVNGRAYVGGLVGRNENKCKNTNCHSLANVSGSANYVGGLAGYLDIAYISNSYAKGNVSGSGDYVGGLAGNCWNGSSIQNCYAAGNVSGNNIVGGLVGSNSCDISNSYAIGSVSGSGDYVGGLAGVTAGGYSQLGTHYYASIQNCYATGSVVGANHVGGLVGRVNDYSTAILNSVAANDVVIALSNTTDISRIVGSIYGGSFLNNYALDTMIVKNSEGNIPITDKSTNAGNGKDINTLQSFGFYSTTSIWTTISWGGGKASGVWDITTSTSVWKICDGKGLPFLRWQGIRCDGEDTTGIVSATLNNQLRVYPNPANGQLTIDCRDVINHVSTVEIYDVVGQKVGTYQFPSFGGAGGVIDAQTTPSCGHPSSGGELAPSLSERAGGEVVIDISHLASGMYFLKVGNKTARFVKE